MATSGECGDCRRNLMASPCCRVGLVRRSSRTRRRAQGVDHISALPDDLLLQVLAGLGCARAAANTGLLARRWRGLWTRLPELSFHDIAPHPLQAALARVASPVGSLVICLPIHHSLSAQRVSSLLRAAVPLSPAKLKLDVHIELDMAASPADDAIELPCFDRATSISLALPPFATLLLPAGGFAALESLSLDYCHGDLDDMLLRRCPRLRKLRICTWRLGSIKVCSPSLEELDVRVATLLRAVHIATPALKKLRFSARRGTDDEFSLSLSAPLVDDLSWRCQGQSTSDRFGVIWRMWSMTLRRKKITTTNNRETARARGNVLWLWIGGTVGEPCSSSCPCDQPNNLRNQRVTLTDLKEVEIQRFRGDDHEVDLLKVIFRSATKLERVTMHFSTNLSPSCSAYMKLPSILKEHPSAEFKIYSWCRKQVFF